MQMRKRGMSLLLSTVMTLSLVGWNNNPDKSDGLKTNRSGFKETTPREEDIPDNTLVNIDLNIQNSEGTGNYSNGKVTGAVPKEETGETKTYTPVYSKDRDPIANNSVVKGTQAEIDELIRYAKSKEGNNYYWAGENVDYPYDPKTYSKGHTSADGVDGADCSGFVWAIYDHIGIKFARGTCTSYSQSLGVEVPQTDIKPGDILILASNKDGSGEIEHTGICLGGVETICADGGPKTPGKITIGKLSGEPGSYRYGYQGVKKIIRLIEVEN